jgi:hypothetical protein
MNGIHKLIKFHFFLALGWLICHKQFYKKVIRVCMLGMAE